MPPRRRVEPAAAGRRAAMHSRIAGTGSYLPAQVLTNDELAQARRDERRVDPHAHRHPRSGTSRPTTSRRAISRSHASRARSTPPASRRADVDLIIVATTTPDMIFPSTACILQAKLGAHGGPAFDVQAVCSGFVYALAIADQMVATGHGAQRAGGRRRNLFAHPRLERPRHLRAVRRRRRRGRAGAVGRRRASCRRICTPTAAIADILCVPGPGAATARSPARRSCRWTGRRVFKFAVKVLADVAHEALAAAGMTPSRRSTG